MITIVVTGLIAWTLHIDEALPRPTNLWKCAGWQWQSDPAARRVTVWPTASKTAKQPTSE
jgi:hypothetical protein